MPIISKWRFSDKKFQIDSSLKAWLCSIWLIETFSKNVQITILTSEEIIFVLSAINFKNKNNFSATLANINENELKTVRKLIYSKSIEYHLEDL